MSNMSVYQTHVTSSNIYGNLGEYGPLKHKTNQFNHRLLTLLLYIVSIFRQASVNHFNINLTSFCMLVFSCVLPLGGPNYPKHLR